MSLTSFYRVLFFSAIASITWLAVMPLDSIPLSTGWDKLNHLLAFAVLLLLLDWSYPSHSVLMAKVLPLILYGCFLECIQAFIPYRDFSVLDIVADIAGLVVYLICRQWIVGCRDLLLDDR